MSSTTASDRPLILPPPGTRPNFTNPPNHGKTQIIVTSLLLGITMILILNRLYMKTYIVHKYTWDDMTILIGVLGTVAYYVASIIGIKKGRLGVHSWNTLMAQAEGKDTLIPQYLISILPALIFLFIKLSFFIMYRQIFRPMRWMRICANLGALFTTLFYVSLTVCALYFATPRSTESWAQHSGSPHAQLNAQLGVPQSCVNLAIDIYILILPVVAVSKLQMALRHKFGIILMFMTGIFACLCSILSIYDRVQAQDRQDPLWDVIYVMTMSLIEMFVGIWCACMPAAGHTYHHHQPSYNSFKQKLRSRYRFWGRETHEKASPFMGGGAYDVTTPRGVHEGYAYLDTTEHSVTVPPMPPQTVIRSAGPKGLDHEGIYLTYELQQTSASPPQDLQWTAV